MKKKFKEIKFKNKNSSKSLFDMVPLKNIFNGKPKDHNQFDFHRVSFYVILLCTRGEGGYNINFKDYDYKKGSLFTLRKDNIHKFYKSKADGQLLVFTENFILNHSNEKEASKIFLLFNEMLASPKVQLDDKDYSEIMTLVKLIRTEYLEADDEYSLSIVRSYVQVLITKLFRVKSKTNIVFAEHKYLSKFLQLQALIEKECFKHKQVSYYAKVLGVTSKTLNNITNSIVHKSAKTLINDIVIIRSKRLIINSSDTLTEIAYQVGFEDPTNFFKFFRKYTSFSPKEFRANHKSV